MKSSMDSCRTEAQYMPSLIHNTIRYTSMQGALDKSLIYICIFVDLQKAFDSVSHVKLIKKLNVGF